MAARHRIANLTRRGNVFYWRARIPSALAIDQGSHLALSLRHGDHTKAKSMVRRLNTLLAELAEGDRARMTSREQLDEIFRAEIERMNESLEDLAFAARRTGSAAEDNLRADLLVGWAYRLIELFGTGRPLRFDASCPARCVLEQAGFAESQISEIAATFEQERRECRTAYFEGFLKSELYFLKVSSVGASQYFEPRTEIFFISQSLRVIVSRALQKYVSFSSSSVPCSIRACAMFVIMVT